MLNRLRARFDEGLGPWWAGLFIILVVGLGILLFVLSLTVWVPDLAP
jgi:hypothetical protein